jgi:outer membrane protein OmpA-like peptidoglycan-associated protein
MIKNFENFDKRMMLIESFEQYDSVNEGWKENVLVGLMSLFGLVSTGQETPKYKFPKDGRQHKIEYSQENVDKLIKRGWSLDSTKIETFFDTLRMKAPNAEIGAVKLKLDNDQFFASGKFKLSDEMKNAISDTLVKIIEQSGVVIKVDIESSTDKQRLKPSLQEELKSLGYSGDNQGLSKARAESISKFLISEGGINETLIEEKNLSEQGSGELGTGIDQSARYVDVVIHYVTDNKIITPPGEEIKRDKDIYFLSKDKGKPTKSNKPFITWSKKTPIKNCKSRRDACPKW